MASGGGGQPSDNGRHRRYYVRENTILIDVLDNNRVKARDVIQSLTELLGEGVVYTCVPKASNIYEVTLADGELVKLAAGGVKVGEHSYECREVVQDTIVVSFLNMSGYIADIDIKTKLNELGVEIVGDIKRRLHPGTSVEDGTRFMRVKFPPTVKSLPYTMRFSNGKHWEHVRVIHNDQAKTCRQCMSTEHLFRDCPEFLCWRCGMQGHFSRQCQEPRCDACGKYGGKCECDVYTIEDCEFCGKCACVCEYCAYCDRPRPDCVCRPDDICNYCSVELQNCQCTACDNCGKLDCWCETSNVPVAAAVTSNHDTEVIGNVQSAVETVSSDQPVVTRTGPVQVSASDPVAEEKQVPPRCREQSETNQKEQLIENKKESLKEKHEQSVDSHRPSLGKDIGSHCGDSSEIYLYPDGSSLSILRPPSSLPKEPATCNNNLGVGRNELGTLLKRRRRLVTEPNIPSDTKRKNIDRSITIS